jgi:uncharacterized protein (TIGR03435 family)
MRSQFSSVRLLLLSIAGVAAAATALGQAATAAAPAALTFDVASVRPAAPIDQATILAGLRAGKRPGSTRIEGTRATFTYTTLKELIAYGYKVRPYQVTGPDWIVNTRFDIAAKLPDGATRDDVPAMMKALLIDRLKLAAHLETKEHPVIGLVVAKGGPKLKESPPAAAVPDDAELKPGETKVDSIDGPIRLLRNNDGSTTYNLGTYGSFTLKVDPQNGTMRMDGVGMTMRGLANMLSTLGGGNGLQVVYLTGLKGAYEFTVEFSLMDLVASLRDQGIEIPGGGAPPDPTGNSTIAEALGKQGLKFEKTKAMVEQLIVDHVEKTATEN